MNNCIKKNVIFYKQYLMKKSCFYVQLYKKECYFIYNSVNILFIYNCMKFFLSQIFQENIKFFFLCDYKEKLQWVDRWATVFLLLWRKLPF